MYYILYEFLVLENKTIRYKGANYFESFQKSTFKDKLLPGKEVCILFEIIIFSWE